MKQKCERCGREFDAYPGKNKKRRCCSRECAYESGRAERFFARTEIITETGCMIWMGYASDSGFGKGNGYGVVGYHGHSYLAHRMSWMLTYGEIPGGICVCHTCDIPLCVNPHHLFLGTRKDNLADAGNKLRMPYGERNHRTKLTRQEVREIRARITDGQKITEIARDYNVTYPAIYSIREGLTWKHLV